MQDFMIECQFTPEQLDVILTALDRMTVHSRDVVIKDKAIKTFAVVQRQRRFGKRSNDLHWTQSVALQA